MLDEPTTTTPMRSQRFAWLLAAACALMAIVAVAAWLVPAYRERAAIAEFKRFGVAVYHDDGRITYVEDLGGNSLNVIYVENGGPKSLRRLIGDEWMQPFDRVAKVHLNFEADPFSTAGSTDQYLPFLLLRRLRSIERLTLYRDLLTEAEIEQLRERFPGIEIEVHPNPMTKQMHFFF